MARRGKGEGSISQRADGLWVARLNIGTDQHGKRIRKAIYGRSKKEVADKLTKMASQKLDGTLASSAKMIVADLLDQWLKHSAAAKCTAGTVAMYEQLVEKHLKPRIGMMRLDRLKPFHVQTMLTDMEEDEVGARTRQHAYVTLHRAFVIAKKWGMAATNPCEAIEVPKVTRREIAPLTAEQSIELLKASESDRLHALYVLALTSGMRLGELLGLQWEDFDRERGTVTVRHSLEQVKGNIRLKEPKSRSGRRQIALPEMTVSALWEHKARMLAEGLAGSSYVFPGSEGGPMQKWAFYHFSWYPLRKACNIASVHFHDLRHSHASLMIAEGVHIKVIQATMGHATIGMTIDTYGHLMPGMQSTAASKFDTLLKVKSVG